jgi:hypothetical protein
VIISRHGGTVTLRCLLIGLLLGTGCWSAAGPAAADGSGVHGLRLEVSVNGRPGLGALRPGIRTGAPVVVSYRLLNRGSADLYDLRIEDPTMPGARIRCPGGRDRVPMLVGLREVRCSATAPARPGTWVGEVRAAGRLPYLRAIVQATARSGYTGVGAALALRESARATGPERAEIRYVLTNTGNRTVHGVRVADPVLARDPVTCAGGRADVAGLAPGATATCTARLRRPPGTYRSMGQARGSDLLRTLGPRGDATASLGLTARASAQFTVTGRAVTARPAPPPPKKALAPPAAHQRKPPTGTVAAPPGLVPPRLPPRAVSPLTALLFPPPRQPAAVTAPGLVPGTTPGFVPGTAPGFAPGTAPWFAPGTASGFAPGFAPGITPRTVPGTVPGTIPRATGTAPGTAPPVAPGNALGATAPAPEAAQVGPSAVAPPAPGRPSRSLLNRFVRADHTPTGLGMMAVLFLLLLPAAIAALLLGSRRP